MTGTQARTGVSDRRCATSSTATARLRDGRAPAPLGRELIDLVLDEDSWTSWDTAPDRAGVAAAYAAELAAAQERSGADESVLTGEGRMRGRRVAVLMGEFAFLAGSIGRAAADRLVAAIERATREGLPLLAGAGVGRYAHAGGHARVRADGADLPGGRGAPGGRAAVPRVPAAPDHRRGDGLVGLARPRDGRGARRAGRVPRARASTRRCTAGRSPRACRPPRTSSPTASSTASSRPRTCRTCSAGHSTS